MPTKLKVVDTNVAIVANGDSPQASDDLQERCIDALLEITRRGGLVLDSDDRIFSEYRHQLSLSGQPGTGDLFMKWVNDNRWNQVFCELRDLTCTDEDSQTFDQFPASPELSNFDVSDRKFVAVANAARTKPPIYQAVDFKWWGWKDALADQGITVHFLDETAAAAGYAAHQGQA